MSEIMQKNAVVLTYIVLWDSYTWIFLCKLDVSKTAPLRQIMVPDIPNASLTSMIRLLIHEKYIPLFFFRDNI
jgi:hypothetical protein